MSTRCQIGIYETRPAGKFDGFTALIYRHRDGYPEGALKDMKPLLAEFNKHRGNDPEYLAAWLVYRLKEESINSLNELMKQLGSKPRPDSAMTGHGICNSLHGDIEYFYAIYWDNKKICVDCYSVPFDWNGYFGDAKLEESIKQ